MLRGRVFPLALLFSCATARPPPRAVQPLPTDWPAEKQARHLLNRLAFGPSPQDRAELLRLGAAEWLDRQLHPESIDDSAVERRLEALPTLHRSTAELFRDYPPLAVRANRAGVDLSSPKARAELMAAVEPDELPRQIGLELASAKLIRAVESRRQLQEVLVDFWFNHFNVSAEKGRVRWMLTSYERDAIRPHVFGRFRDLLGATARHGAMLFYLDNWLSVREGFEHRRAKGLNENYARELLELHTVSVDGGYTQEDVREVARAFTGWSIALKPSRLGEFVFRREAHDEGEKVVLGTRLSPNGGVSDGERVLDLLARHPATARHIALKLCRKFVADEPPAPLVERIAQVFLSTDGDLRAVYRAIFTSPELFSEQAYASKTKTPFELAASALRAAGGTVEVEPALIRALDRLGEPLYRAPAPTGWPERTEAWISSGALLSRINFGLALAYGRLRGAEVELARLAEGVDLRDPDRVIDRYAEALLGGPVSEHTRAVIRAAVGAEAEDGERRPVDVRIVAGLMLGSPEFQKQ